ncbi:MAG: PilZ domain-containing protein [Deltaproteobacteria bacterium]|nr:PilZ domain-containing protein [Deltaproteobacteria bacterium]
MLEMDLKKIIDPKLPLFFLTLKDKNKPIFIRRVYPQSLLVDLHPEMIQTSKIKGFVVAESGQGILEFEANLKLDKLDQEHFDVVEIYIISGSLKKTNRRQSYRLTWASPISAKLITQNNQEIIAKILNLSAEGILFSDEGKLASDEIYQLHLDLDEHTLLNFPIQMFAKREVSNFDPKKQHPAFFLERQGSWNKKTIREKEKELIVRFINKKLQTERKLEKERNESKSK